MVAVCSVAPGAEGLQDAGGLHGAGPATGGSGSTGGQETGASWDEGPLAEACRAPRGWSAMRRGLSAALLLPQEVAPSGSTDARSGLPPWVEAGRAPSFRHHLH